jgi:acetoacetyl-CoA synthetase
MPVRFWNDPGDTKYVATYFERFPGVWCHGDYVELTAHGGLVFHGRSDATLNPGGVRITAKSPVEQLPSGGSLVIGQDWPPRQRRSASSCSCDCRTALSWIRRSPTGSGSTSA